MYYVYVGFETLSTSIKEYIAMMPALMPSSHHDIFFCKPIVVNLRPYCDCLIILFTKLFCHAETHQTDSWYDHDFFLFFLAFLRFLFWVVPTTGPPHWQTWPISISAHLLGPFSDPTMHNMYICY